MERMDLSLIESLHPLTEFVCGDWDSFYYYDRKGYVACYDYFADVVAINIPGCLYYSCITSIPKIIELISFVLLHELAHWGDEQSPKNHYAWHDFLAMIYPVVWKRDCPITVQ